MHYALCAQSFALLLMSFIMTVGVPQTYGGMAGTLQELRQRNHGLG
jgi:hypothetical protein